MGRCDPGDEPPAAALKIRAGCATLPRHRRARHLRRQRQLRFGARILFVTERHLYYLRGSIWSTTNAKAVILKRPLGETPIEASERKASAPHGGGVRQGSVLIGNPKVGIESMRVPRSGLDELKRIVATNLVAAAERS